MIGDVHPTRRMKTLVPFMLRAVANEDTPTLSKFKFVSIKWPKIRIACTTRGSEKIIIRFLMKKLLIRRNIIQGWCRYTIDEKNSSVKGIPP